MVMNGLAPLVVAQITDLHLFAESNRNLLGVHTSESWNAVLAQVAELQRQPDLILLTGDLSQDGKVESYLHLKKSLAPLGIPTYWLPGNHDKLAAMEEVLQGGVISAEKSFAVDNWHFVLLNSQVPGCVHGQISQKSLKWLDRELSSHPEKHAIVALHHPPFRVDSDWLDGSNLQNAEELFEVLEAHPQVKLVLFGHIHQEFSRWRKGIQYFGTPSTCIQFEPHSHEFALDQEPPGFRLLYLYPDETWWTTVERTEYATAQMDLAATGY